MSIIIICGGMGIAWILQVRKQIQGGCELIMQSI